jgi:nicotinate-nucleotide adenylyltransferase
VRIALLGGSFNPPHVGHMMSAYYVLATRDIERLWLMPVFRHPFAKRLAPFDDRMRMCELAARPFGEALAVTRIEEEVPGDGRTVDTLEALSARFPEHRFSLVIGTDILAERSKWKEFDRIERMADLIVVNRAGFSAQGAEGPLLPAVSSTEVRDRLSRRESVAALVPRAVADYIAEKRLYWP